MSSGLQSGVMGELVAQGLMNKLVNEGPNMVSFFSHSYMPYRNFTIGFETFISNGTGLTQTFTIDKNMDLLTNVFLHAQLPALAGTAGSGGDSAGYLLYTNSTDNAACYVPFVGYRLIESAEFRVGGTILQEIKGDYLYIMSELCGNGGNKSNADISGMVGSSTLIDNTPAQNLYVPLNFWFARSASNALPVVALQYNDITVKITFRPYKDLIVVNDNAVSVTLGGVAAGATPPANYNGVGSVNFALVCACVYLEDSERRELAGVAQGGGWCKADGSRAEGLTYIIEQAQYHLGNSTQTGTTNLDLSFNHLTKALIWTIHDTASSGAVLGRANGLFADYQRMDSAEFHINNNRRFGGTTTGFSELMFRQLQAYAHWPRVPAQGSATDQRATHSMDNIYSYSFALSPHLIQPSGSLNLSKVQNARLSVKVAAPGSGSVIDVIAISYNFVNFSAGTALLAYMS